MQGYFRNFPRYFWAVCRTAVSTDESEIDKMMPQVLRYFDLKLAGANAEYESINHRRMVEKNITFIFTQR